MSYNTWKMFQGIFGMLSLSDVGYLPYFQFVLSLQHTIKMPRGVPVCQSLTVHRAIRRNSGNIEPQNIDDGIFLDRQAIRTIKKGNLYLLSKNLYTGWSKKSALFCFSSQSCVLKFFSIFFRWCRQQAWEILLTPIWVQLDDLLLSSQ